MSTVLQAARSAINACGWGRSCSCSWSWRCCHSFVPLFANAEPQFGVYVCVCVCVAGHLSFMWRNALPNCVQIAHTDNSFSLRHIKVFWLCCPGKLLCQHVLHFAACVTTTTNGKTWTDLSEQQATRRQWQQGSNGNVLPVVQLMPVKLRWQATLRLTHRSSCTPFHTYPSFHPSSCANFHSQYAYALSDST